MIGPGAAFFVGTIKGAGSRHFVKSPAAGTFTTDGGLRADCANSSSAFSVVLFDGKICHPSTMARHSIQAMERQCCILFRIESRRLLLGSPYNSNFVALWSVCLLQKLVMLWVWEVTSASPPNASMSAASSFCLLMTNPLPLVRSGLLLRLLTNLAELGVRGFFLSAKSGGEATELSSKSSFWTPPLPSVELL